MAVLLGAVGAVTGVSAASATDTVVGLHNTAAGVGACPASVTGAAWHFVAPPKSKTDFIHITIQLNGVDFPQPDGSWIENPLTGDAYVSVPEEYEIDDLTGGTFTVAGPIDAGGVRLSHTCSGPGEVLEEHLTVTKTVDTSYVRTHNWDLDKSVSASTVKLYIPGQGPSTGSVLWTVFVDYLGAVDSAETISGTVTVTNDGDLDAAIQSIADVFSSAAGDTAVSLDCPDVLAYPHTLTVGSSTACTYSIDGTNKPTGINTATVTTELDEYSDAEAVAWGAPDSEINKTVTASDSYNGAAATSLGAALTAKDGTFSYTKSFNWLDYGVVHDTNCGPYVYDNTATLTGDGGALLDTDSESVTVNVQCYTRQGEETGWASGTTYAGQSSWAMYTSKEALSGGVTIFAGQHFDAGTATLSGTTLTIALANGWEFSDAAASLKVQSYKDIPAKGNVQVGKFETKLNATGTSAVVTVKANNFYGIHLDLVRWIPDPSF